MVGTEHSRPSKDFPGWMDDALGNLTLSVVIAGTKIRLAVVTKDPESGLFETFIGVMSPDTQLGRHDASQERACRRAEDFLKQKLSKLL